MADPEMDEDLFADLYDGEDADPEPASSVPKATPAPAAPEPEVKQEAPVAPAPEAMITEQSDTDLKTENFGAMDHSAAASQSGFSGGFGQQQGGGFGQQNGGFGNNGGRDDDSHEQRPIGNKEDGKMFIGGLNWETTDQSLKEYFSQFGEVLECTVMRDGATGRSRGFGFLTFKDPKTVNTVMVKEHELDGKLIDPKRAIPRDEQERTAKIFVGGVSQEATEPIFKDFFKQFGTVLDATLMMDKDTGRPRGFGFVTFDGESAVDRTLEGPLAILGKSIEVKRAQPRGNMRDDDGPRGGKFNTRGVKQEGGGQFNNNNFGSNQDQSNGGGDQGTNNMSPAMMAQYWQRMQQYFQMMQQQMAGGQMAGGMSGAGGMNMAAMQQNPAMMQQMMQRQGMNPQMMQQMAAMQQGGGGYPGIPQTGMPQTGSPMNGGVGARPGGFSAQEQLMFEQQKYERQAMGGVGPAFTGGNQNTWDGMYEGAEAPAGFNANGGARGGFNNRGRGGRGSQGPSQPAANAPPNAPTGPKNAGRPGANYRGGGRGGAGRGGFHPYNRPGT